MADGRKPCPERRKLKGREIFWRILPIGVTVLLFVILYFVVNPRITAQEKIERHEARITSLESTVQRFMKIEDRVDKIYEYLLGVKP
jgi:hypothetical protein